MKKGWSPQDIEFTFEGPHKEDLYLLQTRDMAYRARKRVLTFDSIQKGQSTYLGHGLGVSGGAMSGRLVFTLEEVEAWRQKEPDTMLILARGDTVRGRYQRNPCHRRSADGPRRGYLRMRRWWPTGLAKPAWSAVVT